MAQEHRRGRKAEYTDRPLTEEEKIFAEEHHDMIYRYLRIHGLSIDPWYDILIIPYLQAVKKYHIYEHLQKLKFDQIFFRTLDNARSNHYRDMNRQKRRPEGKVVSFDEVISSIYSDNENGACMEILGGVSENYHNTIEHQIIDKLELDNLMDEFDRDNQRKIFELLIVGYSQKEIRKLLKINLYRWKKLMTDTKVLVEKYLDEYYND